MNEMMAKFEKEKSNLSHENKTRETTSCWSELARGWKEEKQLIPEFIHCPNIGDHIMSMKLMPLQYNQN